MSVVIITDSASDLDAAERRRLRVEVIGIRVFLVRTPIWKEKT